MKKNEIYDSVSKDKIYDDVAKQHGWENWEEVKKQNHWTIHRLRQEAEAIIYKLNNLIITAVWLLRQMKFKNNCPQR